MTSTDGLPELPGIDKQDGLTRMMNKPLLYEKILRDFHARFMNEAASFVTPSTPMICRQPNGAPTAPRDWPDQ